jgi:phosphocarrier protein HPr
MTPMTLRKEFTIVNKLGLHARPAAQFVRLANRFDCEIWVEKDSEQVNGKSIMGLMMLAAGHGSKISVMADGNQADEALKAVEELIASGFKEE